MALCLTRLQQTRPLIMLLKCLPHFYSKFEVDVLDDFTSRLMQQKIRKWQVKKRKIEVLIESQSKNENSQIINKENINPGQLDTLFRNSFDSEDSGAAISLANLCIDFKTPPPENLIVKFFSICAQNGEKDTIFKLLELCERSYPQLLKENSNFRHFLAEAIWRKGDVSKAVEIFEEVYRANCYLRRTIRLMFRDLTNDLVANGSEAALSNMIKFSERISTDFQDFVPLTCVWQACFLSEWFTDQCTALNLLEKHNRLCKFVINRIPYVVFVSLKCHRTEVVYRLLEILLKYEMKKQYSSVLGTLLDYQFQRGDWNRCSEIINWAVTNNVALPQKHHIKMINLILNEKMKTPLAPLQKSSKETKCNFKF